jgi:hypothetical protein
MLYASAGVTELWSGRVDRRASAGARPPSVGGTAALRGCAVTGRRDGTCELPIASAEIPIDRTADEAMSC